MSKLPGILADIAEVAGEAAALELARECGGLQISLSDAEGSTLARAVGADKAKAIVSALGRGRVIVPMATARGQRGRQRAAAELLAKGATGREVALACDVHIRTAWRAKARLARPRDSDQNGDLFDEE